jgi:hypothetical protein
MKYELILHPSFLPFGLCAVLERVSKPFTVDWIVVAQASRLLLRWASGLPIYLFFTPTRKTL